MKHSDLVVGSTYKITGFHGDVTASFVSRKEDKNGLMTNVFDCPEFRNVENASELDDGILMIDDHGLSSVVHENK